jgi:hypothetical protein
MITKLQMGSIARTAAGQGWNRFRRHDMSVPIYAHQVPSVRKMERAAWHGGRCECFRLGKIDEPLWMLDVKSMYASIGARERFPIQLIDYGDGCPLAFSQHRGHMIAEVRISTDEPAYPVRHKGIVVWPVGEYVTTLAWPELSHALACNRVIEIRRWANYSTAPIFKTNSQWYFDARKSLSDKGFASMAGPLKAAQNAMYGYIGRRGKSWVDCEKRLPAPWGQWWCRHPDTGLPTIYRSVGEVNQYADDRGEPVQAAPAIPATMSSYGRMILWDLIRNAGRENTYYVNTDGMMVNAAGRDRLIRDGHVVDGVPGKLDCRGTADHADIRACNHYQFGGKWTQGGAPKGCTRDSDGNVVWDEHVSFDSTLWQMDPFAHRYIMKLRAGHRAYRHGHVDRGIVTPLTSYIDREGNNQIG